jgi:hypothetical protein
MEFCQAGNSIKQVLRFESLTLLCLPQIHRRLSQIRNKDLARARCGRRTRQDPRYSHIESVGGQTNSVGDYRRKQSVVRHQKAWRQHDGQVVDHAELLGEFLNSFSFIHR